MGLKIPGEIPQSPTNATLTAVLAGLNVLDERHNVDIKTDDTTALQILSKQLKKWEDVGFVSLTNKALVKALIAQLRQRTGIITISEALDGSTQAAKALAKASLDNLGLRNDRPGDLRIRSDVVIRGAKLTNLTQASAYKLIRETVEVKERRTTDRNISQIQAALLLLNNVSPTEAQIWRSIRSTDFLRRPRNFLYLAINQAHKLGKFWLRIPDFCDWGTCQYCNETESMEHILFECRRPGQVQLWNLAQLLWKGKNLPWPQMSMGLALGCGLVKFYNDDKHRLYGAERLFRIVVAETMHAIWKIRCDVVLKRNNSPIAIAKAHNTWVQALNERLKYDCFMTNQARYGKRALNPKLVLCTWSGVLKDKNDLPDSWIMEPKVLVGIEPITTLPQRSKRSRDRPGRNR
ncbi:hypothetical protein C8J56DRAFT_786334 [Mycena floridula]|nr:hypothetical protein C8J56DRAFT_786334 [Mycena floridula]